MPDEKPLTLQEFLLAYAVGVAAEGVVPLQRGAGDPESQAVRELRAEVLRHSDRTMTVVSMTGTVTLTRCRVCASDQTRPCRALRILALPFAAHPAFRPEWHVDEPRLTVLAGRGAEMFTPPPPYPKISELPPPGRERRRLLRQCGIAISQGDYAEEERSPLGTGRAPGSDAEETEETED